MQQHNIIISNTGFGKSTPQVLSALREQASLKLKESSEKLDEAKLSQFVKEATILIAGTEKITRKVLDNAPLLKLIARVGVGVDNIDLEAAREKKITITYTPTAPSVSLPEFTLTLMLNLIKHISMVDRQMHAGQWKRPMGRLLSSVVVGVVGAGKIGGGLIHLLKALYPQLKINFFDPCVESISGAQKMSLEDLMGVCDIVTLHLPLNDQTHNLIDQVALKAMKRGSYLINTSRGGIVNEDALAEALRDNYLAGAAIDVFEQEPYAGPLTKLENCLLTSHIGSMTYESRVLMETQVGEDVMRFIQKKPLLQPLPGYNFCED